MSNDAERRRGDTDRLALIAACDESLRRLRNEYGLTQDDMAHELGISKKTLIGIEKGRSSLGWTGSAALCLLFGDSAVLRRELKGDPRSAAAGMRGAHGVPRAPEPTNAVVASDTSSPLWRHISTEGEYRIEQNVISEHYRLVDKKGARVSASFDLNEIKRTAVRLSYNDGAEGSESDE